MFENRIDAAYQLMNKLQKYKHNSQAILFAIPRGGLEIGAILRDELHLPLDIVVTKKIGAPGNEEYGIGVVDQDGKAEFNQRMISYYQIHPDDIRRKVNEIKKLIDQRVKDYHQGGGGSDAFSLKGKIAILVDDGVATGYTTLAAIHYLRRHKPEKVILAVPVMPRSIYQKLSEAVDELICLDIHEDFYAVSQFYRDFSQVTDEEAKSLLNFKKAGI